MQTGRYYDRWDIDGINVTEQPKTIKSKPVFAVERSNERECYRCGAYNFTMDHLKKCVAKNHLTFL